MKKLVIDIETSPHLVWSFQLFKTTIPADHIVEPSRVICFAAKWVGSDEIIFASEFHDGREAMLAKAHALLSEADVAVHYNGIRFDEKRLNGDFELFRLGPPAPFQRVDLWQTVIRCFDFASSKLAFVAPHLGIGSKLGHEGFSLWLKCLAGDPEAWEQMKAYCCQDVEVTEDLFLRLVAWVPGLPSEGAYTGLDVCPVCGSEDLRRQGWAYTKTGRYQRYLCPSGHWSQDTHRSAHTNIKAVAA